MEKQKEEISSPRKQTRSEAARRKAKEHGERIRGTFRNYHRLDQFIVIIIII